MFAFLLIFAFSFYIAHRHSFLAFEVKELICLWWTPDNRPLLHFINEIHVVLVKLFYMTNKKRSWIQYYNVVCSNSIISATILDMYVSLHLQEHLSFWKFNHVHVRYIELKAFLLQIFFLFSIWGYMVNQREINPIYHNFQNELSPINNTMEISNFDF